MSTPRRTLEAVAHLVSYTRPKWQPSGVLAALTRREDSDLATLTLAALIAATTRQDQATPAVIALDGPHWDQAAQALGHGKPAPTIHQAPRCEHGQVEGACRGCRPASDPAIRAQAIADAKTAIRKTAIQRRGHA